MRYVLIAILVTTLLLPTSAKAVGVIDVFLIGPGGIGGTTTFGTTATTNYNVGNVSGSDTWIAQSFMIAAGTLTQIQVRFNTNVGSPTGTMTWGIYDDVLGIPGSLLQSGTFTPTANSLNVITVVSGIFLDSGTQYWLRLNSTSPQGGGISWRISGDLADVYSDGHIASTADAGVLWTIRSNQDILGSITTDSSSTTAPHKIELAQSFTVGQNALVSTLDLYLKKIGSPAGDLTASIEIDVANTPSDQLIDPDATATISEAILITDYAYTTFTFSEPIQLYQGVKYWIVLSTTREDTSDYVAWGSSLICSDNEMRSLIDAAWEFENKAALFSINIDSFNPTNTLQYVTLTSGQQASIDYQITAGEAAITTSNLVLIGLIIGCLFLLMVIARRVNYGR